MLNSNWIGDLKVVRFVQMLNNNNSQMSCDILYAEPPVDMLEDSEDISI